MAANGKRGRTKLPLITFYRMCGWSKPERHKIPFHIVGIHEGRNYSVAVRRDQIDSLIEKLQLAKTEYDSTYPEGVPESVEAMATETSE